MNRALAPLAVLFFASLASAPSSDAIEFGVSKGTKLTKHFEVSFACEKKAISMKVGEKELPKELTEKFEMSFSLSEACEVEDEYVELDGARPTTLLRLYRSAKKHSTDHVLMMDGTPKDSDEDVVSQLVDHTVAFTWNAKDEKYDREFRGEKGDAKWLEKLKEDLDFQRVLPDHKVSVGDTWKIEPKDFNELVMPGGDQPYEPKKKKSHDLEFDKNLSGEAEAKYEGTRDVDGQKRAVIALKAKLTTFAEPEEDEEMPMRLEISFELEGELLWDVENKHFASYDLRGPLEMTLSGAKEIEANGQTLDLKMRFELAGEMKASGSS